MATIKFKRGDDYAVKLNNLSARLRDQVIGAGIYPAGKARRRTALRSRSRNPAAPYQKAAAQGFSGRCPKGSETGYCSLRYRVYMMASANKFLRIYYATVKAYLESLEQF